MYTPELAGVGNIKLPADTLADGTPLNKKPAGNAGKDGNNKGQVAEGDKGKSSAMPVPEPVKASNGLMYQSNPKHTPGVNGTNPRAGIEPKNSLDLFGNSIPYGGKRYAKDNNGNVHQFADANDGTWHWAGSMGNQNSPMKLSDIPAKVRKQLGLPVKGK